MNSLVTVTPFLRWAGSKRQILTTLSTHWSIKFKRYLEPFLGSGSLFFYLQPKCAILGDINPELIATYKQVRDNLLEVLLELSTMHKGKNEYYKIRSIDSNSLPPPQRAARFIYLNRYSFNGLYRTNQNGDFNVPYGGEKSGNIPRKESLEACCNALQTAQLISGDFELVLSQARAGDFVYLDPPYNVKAHRVFNEYNPSNFGAHDLQRLRWWLDKLTKIGVEFLVSYAQFEEAEFLMKGYTAKEITVRRNIAGFSGNRRKAGEWLITNKEILASREDFYVQKK